MSLRRLRFFQGPAQNLGKQLIDYGPLLGEDAAGNPLTARREKTKDDAVTAHAQA